MPIAYIDDITERYQRLGYPPYRWYRADTPPAFAALKKPLSQSRIGMLGTCGAYAVGQRAYYYKDDSSIRQIPSDTVQGDLRFSHITENYLVDGKQDPNCIFPLESLRSLSQDGEIGELPEVVLSCMGGVYSQRRVREEMLPEVAGVFQSQNLDAVLLVPM